MEDIKRDPLWKELLEAYKMNKANGESDDVAMCRACVAVGASRSSRDADEIMRVVCHVGNYHGISIHSLKRPNRAPAAAMARSQAAWIARKLGHSLQSIGKNIGNRHHTTIMECVNRVNRSEAILAEANELLGTFQGKDKCE